VEEKKSCKGGGSALNAMKPFSSTFRKKGETGTRTRRDAVKILSKRGRKIG